jgi:hypothetical protein
MTNKIDAQLEPRVAKLETGLDILTQNVQNLTTAVRENSIAMEDKLERITIAVTQAQAPRKTDWSIVISGIFLIMAIGSAVFWPLNQTSQNNKTEMEKMEQKFEQHQSLTLHPVGAAKVEALEISLGTTKQELISRDAALDSKIQRETILSLQTADTKINDLDIRIQKEFNLKDESMNKRLERIESYMEKQDQADFQELRNWRLKAIKGPILTNHQ